MIQYNLARLRSAPANRNYLAGFDRMLCQSYGCKSWRSGEGRYCVMHAQPPEGKVKVIIPKGMRHAAGLDGQTP